MNRRQIIQAIPGLAALAVLPSVAKAALTIPLRRPEDLLLLSTEEITAALLEAHRRSNPRSINTIMFPVEERPSGIGVRRRHKAFVPEGEVEDGWMVGEIPSPAEQLEMAVHEAVLAARDQLKVSSRPSHPTYSFWDEEQEQQVSCTIEGPLGFRWDYETGQVRRYGTLVYPDRVTAVW